MRLLEMGAALNDFHYALMGAMSLNPLLLDQFDMEDWLVMAPFVLGALLVNHRVLFYPILYIILIRPKMFNPWMIFWSIGIWLALMLTS